MSTMTFRDPDPTGIAPDPRAQCWCATESQAGPVAEILVVRVSGELDLLSRPAVEAALSEAVRRAPGHLVVDLSGLRFCCVRGFELLAETAFAARTVGIGFALSGLTAHHDRIVSLVMVHGAPVRHPSVGAAVRAIRRSHAGDAPPP